MVASARPCRVEAKPSAVVEALRRHLDRYLEVHAPDPAQVHVLLQLLACRTPAMGTHRCVCEACGWSAQVCISCRNRHCPRCQGRETDAWLKGRLQRMVPVPHFQVVFTLPAELRPLARDNPRRVYDLLMRSAASVLQDLAAQRMQARLGLTTVLHTWTSEMGFHPHVHALVTAGGLSLDDARWVPTREGYLFPQKVMGAMFRGRMLTGLIAAHDAGELWLRGDDEAQAARDFRAMTRRLAKRHARWVVHVEPPQGREVSLVVKYLARYVKRVALSDARVVEVTDETVTLRTRRGPLTLDGAEFVRRFLLHVLPRRFVKVRHYGLYAPGNAKRRLELARSLLSPQPDDVEATSDDGMHEEPEGEVCPECGAARVVRVFQEPLSPSARGPP